jgi:hypothetical protein
MLKQGGVVLWSIAFVSLTLRHVNNTFVLMLMDDPVSAEMGWGLSQFLKNKKYI